MAYICDSPRQKPNIISLRIQTMLLCLMHCSSKLSLRAGLIHAVQMCVRYSCIYAASISSTLNGISVLQHFECGNTIELHNGIMIDYYQTRDYNNGVISTVVSRKSAHPRKSTHPLLARFPVWGRSKCTQMSAHPGAHFAWLMQCTHGVLRSTFSIAMCT